MRFKIGDTTQLYISVLEKPNVVTIGRSGNIEVDALYHSGISVITGGKLVPPNLASGGIVDDTFSLIPTDALSPILTDSVKSVSRFLEYESGDAKFRFTNAFVNSYYTVWRKYNMSLPLSDRLVYTTSESFSSPPVPTISMVGFENSYCLYAENLLDNGDSFTFENIWAIGVRYKYLYIVSLVRNGFISQIPILTEFENDETIIQAVIEPTLNEDVTFDSVRYIGEYYPVSDIYGSFDNIPKDFVLEVNDEPYTPGYGGGVTSGTGGGGGNFGIVNGTPETSDPIAPSLPPTGSFEGSVANSGLFVHYAMNANMLEIVGDWLWATDLGLIIAKEVLSILYGSPIESAISLMSYPFNVTALPGVVSNQQELFWGAHGAGFNATAITNPYATIDWGTVQLTEFWGNFLDYAPHTKLELYLPWCTGFVPIDPNECLPGTLRVVTNIELAKGTCLHNVIGNDGRVIATHAGTCGKQLPLTALDTSGKALAFVTSAVAGATVGGAAIGGAMGGAMYPGAQPITLHSPYDPNKHRYLMMDKSPSISSISEGAKMGASMFSRAAKKPAVMAASAGLRAQVSVSRNGSFTGSTAGLGVQFPYLIISRPTQSVPAQYGHHYGYPSNIYTPLANLRGYTEVGEIHLTGFVCTEEELEEIDSILKGGVIL